MHGENNLSKAINLLNEENRNNFSKFVNNEVSFNPHNMFICKSKIKLQKYYEDLFPWLEKCEKIFGFENLEGYGKNEKFMGFWQRDLCPIGLKKTQKYVTIPIIFYDIRKDFN